MDLAALEQHSSCQALPPMHSIWFTICWPGNAALQDVAEAPTQHVYGPLERVYAVPAQVSHCPAVLGRACLMAHADTWKLLRLAARERNWLHTVCPGSYRTSSCL